MALRDDPSGAQRHANVLQGEGVEVVTKSDGRLCELGGTLWMVSDSATE